MPERDNFHNDIYAWLRRDNELKRATAELQPFISNELNMSYEITSLRGVLGICKDSREHDEATTYKLLIDERASDLDISYLTLLTASSILLGHMYDEDTEELAFPYPSPLSLRELNPFQRRNYQQALLLCSDMIEGMPSEEWDKDVRDLLQQKGPLWKKTAMQKGDKIVKLLTTPQMDYVRELLDERLSDDLNAH